MRTLSMLALALAPALDACNRLVTEGPTLGLVGNALSLGDGSDWGMGGVTMGDAELINDLADVGALPARFIPRQARRIPQPVVRPGYALPARRLIPQIPGSPSVGLRLQPLGLSTQIFTAASGTALVASTQPQRPFKCKRLVVDIARTGVTSTGLISVTSILIGTNNQMVSPQPIGAGAFAPGAFDTNLELAACTTALTVSVGYTTSLAPTNPDNIAIGTTMTGETVG